MTTEDEATVPGPAEARRWSLRRDDHEGGFTLIELMVVVLIIGILLAIAIPLFLGARTTAQNRASESNLRNALTTARTYYTNNSTYATVTAATLQAAEPSLTFVGAAPTSGSTQVGVGVVDANGIWFDAQSATGSCFYVADMTSTGSTLNGQDGINAVGTWYGSTGTTCLAPGSSAPSGVTFAPTPGPGGW